MSYLPIPIQIHTHTHTRVHAFPPTCSCTVTLLFTLVFLSTSPTSFQFFFNFFYQHFLFSHIFPPLLCSCFTSPQISSDRWHRQVTRATRDSSVCYCTKPSRSRDSWGRWPRSEVPTLNPAFAAASSTYVSFSLYLYSLVSLGHEDSFTSETCSHRDEHMHKTTFL